MKNIFALTLASTISLSALAAPTYKPIEVHAPKPGETQYKPAELTPDKIRALSLKSPEVRTETERLLISKIIGSKLSNSSIGALGITNELSTAARNFSGVLDIILTRANIIVDKSTKTEAKEVAKTELKLAAEIGKLDVINEKEVKAAEVLTAIINMPAEKASMITFKNNLLSKLKSRQKDTSIKELIIEASDGLAATGKKIDWEQLRKCLGLV